MKFGLKKRRIDALNALLKDWDLPGGEWNLHDERTWRFDEYPHLRRSDVVDRGLEHGGIVAWRSFANDDGHSSLWVQFMPYASIEDAEATIPHDSTSFVKNSAFDGEVGETLEVSGYELPGIDHASFFEETISTPRGRGSAKRICGNVKNLRFTVASAASGDGLSWEDLISIATQQVKKIEQYLDER